jgi:two-component system phosphate regulon sensor histidine kinase PhoR
MLVLELRWLLFVPLLALVALGLGALWRGPRLRRGGHDSPALPAPDGPNNWLERAPLGILALEGSRTCRYANLCARQLLGLDDTQRKLPDAAWLQTLEADRLAAGREGAPATCHRTVSLPANQPGPTGPSEPATRFIHWWVVPHDELDVVFLLDQTAQRRAEEAARYLVNDLSHELRTPLATILTHLEVLGLADLSGETGRQSIVLLKAEAQRMARLIQQMLELGRLETSAELERRPLDLLALVEEVIQQATPQAEERGIAISLQADPELPLAVGDQDRLRQVFLNLLDNAVKYCRPGDTATISLQPVLGGIACRVEDDGPGIPARHLPHLTRRFYRAASRGQAGSGLGLALVEEILRRHESRLAVESRAEGESTGTAVRFVLPALSGATENREAARP